MKKKALSLSSVKVLVSGGYVEKHFEKAKSLGGKKKKSKKEE